MAPPSDSVDVPFRAAKGATNDATQWQPSKVMPLGATLMPRTTARLSSACGRGCSLRRAGLSLEQPTDGAAPGAADGRAPA
eukprot:5092976-Pyramimonas_sp.AAC.1